MFGKKEIFLGIHYAVASSLIDDISTIEILLFHTHTSVTSAKLEREFPQLKTIFAVRDPRATYASFKQVNPQAAVVNLATTASQTYPHLKKKKDSYVLVIEEF